MLNFNILSFFEDSCSHFGTASCLISSRSQTFHFKLLMTLCMLIYASRLLDHSHTEQEKKKSFDLKLHKIAQSCLAIKM